jgi:hypothetical protein
MRRVRGTAIPRGGASAALDPSARRLARPVQGDRS